MEKRFTAALFLASTCALGTAHAQSSVTLYGLIDNGIEYQNGGNGGAFRAVSGGLYATVFGFRGREDLGGGLQLNFTLEEGFSGQTGAQQTAGYAFNRLAWVGLAGDWGEFRIGRQKKPEYLLLNDEMDPTGVKSIASPLDNFMAETVRSNNAIAYFLPVMYGLTVQFMVAMRDSTTKPTDGLQFYNAAARYVHGPFRLAGGYEQQGNATGTSLQRIVSAVASMGIGDGRVYMSYHSERQSDHSENFAVYEASGSYSFTAADQLSLMYAYAHDQRGLGNNAQQVGVVYEYSLSRRTKVYGALGIIQNRNQAAYSLNGTAYSGVTVAPGAFARGIMFGIANRF